MPVRYASRNPPRRPSPAEVPQRYGEVPVQLVAAPSEERMPPRRSHAAAFAAIALLLVGWLLMSWTILIPILIAFFLLSAGVAFLGTRLNPLSVGFYLTTKPSWSAIATVFLTGLALLGIVYASWKQGSYHLLPSHPLPTW